jgi:hypothetical protein
MERNTRTRPRRLMLQIFWPRALPSESTVHETPPSKDCGPVPQTMFPLGVLKNAADAADGTEATNARTLSAKPALIALLAHTGRLQVAGATRRARQFNRAQQYCPPLVSSASRGAVRFPGHVVQRDLLTRLEGVLPRAGAARVRPAA